MDVEKLASSSQWAGWRLAGRAAQRRIRNIGITIALALHATAVAGSTAATATLASVVVESGGHVCTNSLARRTLAYLASRQIACMPARAIATRPLTRGRGVGCCKDGRRGKGSGSNGFFTARVDKR